MNVRNTLLAFTMLLVPAAAFADDAAPPARKNDPHAIRCVRMPVTGSLAQVRKVCKTNDEWNRIREEVQRINLQTCAGANCMGR